MSKASEQAPAAPVIEFPCRYPVKVMGHTSASFHREIVEVFRRHASGVTDEDVSVRESAKGNYLAVTVTIEATGETQLTALFADLKAVDGVKLVL